MLTVYKRQMAPILDAFTSAAREHGWGPLSMPRVETIVSSMGGEREIVIVNYVGSVADRLADLGIMAKDS